MGYNPNLWGYFLVTDDTAPASDIDEKIKQELLKLKSATLSHKMNTEQSRNLFYKDLKSRFVDVDHYDSKGDINRYDSSDENSIDFIHETKPCDDEDSKQEAVFLRKQILNDIEELSGASISNGYSDMNYQERTIKGHKIVIYFAGDNVDGDEPEGEGFMVLKLLYHLGISELLYTK